MSTIRILIADDETTIRRLLAFRFRHEPDLEVVGEAADGRRAVELAQELRPDVVLMDMDMPLLNGIQATERIMAANPHARVIILTSFKNLASLGRLAGAREWLSKEQDPDELVAAVRRVAGAAGSPAAAETAADPTAAVARLSERFGLTEWERTVVERVVGTDLTVLQLAAALAAERGESVTHAAVKHALDRAMTKLRVEPRTRAALLRRVAALERGA